MRRVLLSIFIIQLDDIIGFDKCIHVLLQIVQRYLKFPSESRMENIPLQQPVELLAKIVIGFAGSFHGQVLDVRSGEIGFKWMGGRQAAIFTCFSSVNFLDASTPTLEKRHN